MKRKGAILKKSYNLAIAIVEQYERIRKERKEYTLSKQLVRCGTSICANANEAQHAESRKDFIHKLSISQKECIETIFWLNLLKDTHYLNAEQFANLHPQAVEILKMISSALITSKSILNTK